MLRKVGVAHPAPYTAHPTPCTLHPTPYTLYPTPLHPTPYTLHSTSYTLHSTPYTLHPTPNTLLPTTYTLHPALYTLQPSHGKKLNGIFQGILLKESRHKTKDTPNPSSELKFFNSSFNLVLIKTSEMAPKPRANLSFTP